MSETAISPQPDCPCPGLFKAVAYCPDCPYRTDDEFEREDAEVRALSEEDDHAS